MKQSPPISSFVLLALLISTPAMSRSPVGTHAIRVDAGWNLMSLPVGVGNGSKQDLFPSSVSPAFIFNTQSGYTAQDTLHNGVGFWLKFADADTVFVAGFSMLMDTIEVHAGWNIIGSLSMPIVVDSIQTEPPGIITSQFFGYTPGAGYDDVSILQPATGYWLKASQNGVLILNTPGVPCAGTPTVTHEGRTYNTVQIGTQCWMRENLNVGMMIPGAQGQTDNSIIEKYCYNNDTANCIMWGGLYQWHEAMQYDTAQGSQGFCPSGWHIPTMEEFQTLSATAGDANALKAIGQGSGAGAGTNTSGFSALIAGWRDGGGSFNLLYNDAAIWSSSQYDAGQARFLYMWWYAGGIWLDQYNPKSHGFSVRCIQD